jgi:iron(III) transport system ATP-binding protein
LAVSDRIVVMSNARIAQEGTPRDLYDWPANAFVADFVGEANLFDCEVLSISDGKASAKVGPAALTLPARGLSSGPAKLAVRPDRLILQRPDTPNTVPGTIRKVTYVGRHLEFAVETAAGNVFVVSRDVDGPFAEGDAIGIGFPDRGPVLIPA